MKEQCKILRCFFSKQRKFLKKVKKFVKKRLTKRGEIGIIRYAVGRKSPRRDILRRSAAW